MTKVKQTPSKTATQARAEQKQHRLNHARKDYQRMVTSATDKIDPTEPVFLLRAKDELFIPILQTYVTFARALNVDPLICDSLEAHLIAARVWQRKNKTKLPDMEYETFKF